MGGGRDEGASQHFTAQRRGKSRKKAASVAVVTNAGITTS